MENSATVGTILTLKTVQLYITLHRKNEIVQYSTYIENSATIGIILSIENTVLHSQRNKAI